MGVSIVADTARSILHNEPPSKVVKLADSLWLQSTTSIPLKPNLEPARIHICCVLAIEKLGVQLGLPSPDTQKPPVPPSVYKKLLDQFRHSLAEHAVSSLSEPPVTGPGKRRQRRTLHNGATQSSVHASEAFSNALQKGAESEKPAADGLYSEIGNNTDTQISDLGNSNPNDLDNDNNPVRNDSDDEDDALLHTPRTPGKRAPAYTRAGSPTPRKTSPRKRTKSALPTPELVEQIGGLMGLAPETTSAIQHAFQQYADLVKEPWGLVYGLFAVISERAEPRMGMDNLNRLDRALRELGPPRLFVDPNEWVPWVERIVTGQTWIMKISKQPEPIPKLVGAPGGWGLGVEYSLVNP